MNSDTIIAFS